MRIGQRKHFMTAPTQYQAPVLRGNVRWHSQMGSPTNMRGLQLLHTTAPMQHSQAPVLRGIIRSHSHTRSPTIMHTGSPTIAHDCHGVSNYSRIRGLQLCARLRQVRNIRPTLVLRGSHQPQTELVLYMQESPTTVHSCTIVPTTQHLAPI